MAEFIYTLHKARKAHGDKVILDNVTLAFLPGAKIGVVGPNGAGKSTLLKIMAGIEDVSNGEAKLHEGFTVGILMQEPKLDESKSVLENVEEGVAETKAMVDRFNQISVELAEPDADYDSLLGRNGQVTRGNRSSECLGLGQSTRPGHGCIAVSTGRFRCLRSLRR